MSIRIIHTKYYQTFYSLRLFDQVLIHNTSEIWSLELKLFSSSYRWNWDVRTNKSDKIDLTNKLSRRISVIFIKNYSETMDRYQSIESKMYLNTILSPRDLIEKYPIRITFMSPSENVSYHLYHTSVKFWSIYMFYENDGKNNLSCHLKCLIFNFSYW